MNRTRNNNRSKTKKYIDSMNNEITFYNPKYNEPNENEIKSIKDIFPEFDKDVIIETLKLHNLNVEATIDDLLSLRFINQNLSSNDIKRTHKIMEVYNNNTNDKSQELVFNGNNTVVINDLSNTINRNKEGNNEISSNEFLKKKKNKKKSLNNNINLSNVEEDNSAGYISNQSVDNNNNNNNNGNTDAKKKRNRRRNRRKNSHNTDDTTSDTNSNDNDNDNGNDENKNKSIPNIQSYYKLSELKNIFPDVSDRLLLLTLQVNNGEVEKVVDFLLMQNNIKKEINEEDLCRSLELQLENRYGNGETTCDGNCISQGYPCFIHSRLILTKDDEYNTLNLSEIMKIWNQYELRDHNINVGFSNNSQAIKYYTEDNDEIEFTILNRIKEAELAMTPEERNHQDDVHYFREREAELKNREHEFFSVANKKYKSGGLTGFSSAAYYSEEGRQLKEEIEKIKLLAVSAQIKQNERNYMQNNGLNSFCGVDLHGLTVKEALPYLIDMLNIWKLEVMKHNPKYNKGVSKKPLTAPINTTTETYDFNDSNVKSFSKIVSSTPKKKEDKLHNLKITKVQTLNKKKTKRNYPSVFSIITGRGIHSDANIGARLKPSIMNYLRNNKFDFVEVNSGSIEVRL